MKLGTDYIKKIALAGALGLAATAAQAETLRYAVGFGPSSYPVQALYETNEFLKAEGEIDLKIFPLSLLNLKETPPGLRDGLAEAGYIITPYYPAEYAEMNVAAEMSMLTSVGQAAKSTGAVMAGVVTEYVMLHCPDCIEQHKRENQVFLGGMGTPEYVMLCTSPVRSIADLEGKRLRSSLAAMGRWAESFGATKVSIPANEIYEAMSQGVVDCTMISAPELVNLQLMDVTKYVTLGLPGGSFSGVGALNVNLDTWQDLTSAQRESLFRAAAFNSAKVTFNYYKGAQEALVQAEEQGIEIIAAPQDLKDATEAFVFEDIQVIKNNFSNDFGLENVEAKVQTIVELIAKWKAITDEIADSPEALQAAYEQEIFSKIDAETYFMN
jgi:TRAP-type C4-dicarboxylate transport system substrate-binding protein